MSAAVLAITPRAPDFATSAWLGGAGLSICGLFVVQYISIKAFAIADDVMGELVNHENHYDINTMSLAWALASPVIMAYERNKRQKDDRIRRTK
jgi:hypothetical protein